MKRIFAIVFLYGLTLLAWGSHPLLAQQASPLVPGGQQLIAPSGNFTSPTRGQVPGFYSGVTPQGGPQEQGYYPPTPYVGAQPYAPFPQTGAQGQGFYRPETIFGPQGSLRSPLSPSDLAELNRRHCPAISSLPPSLPARPAVPDQSQTTPVQGLWSGPGETGALREIAGIQQSESQTGSGLWPLAQPKPAASPAELPPQGFRPASPGQLFSDASSPVEASFQQIPNFTGQPRRELQQYGYTLFVSPISTFAPVQDVPVGPDYILGPGDDLGISVWGARDGSTLLTVDRNGEIFFPTVGPIRVWGLSFSQADRVIREQLSNYYRGLQVSITLGRLRSIRVYIVGEVCQPGSFTLSSLSTVTNALFASGGPLKMGSLRNIQLRRNQHLVGTLDLYDFLLRGDKTRDFRLESGDTIFVPPIGPVAAIDGEVKRPAIYELTGPTRISELVAMAGGLTPQSYLKRVQTIRVKPNAEREVIDLDLSSVSQNGDFAQDVEVRNGDLVRIYPTDPRIYNTIRLAGAIKHPGEYELKPGMRVSQILDRDIVLPEAYLDRIDIARVRDDFSAEVVQVNLREIWAGNQSQDLFLRPRDLITVRSEYRMPWSVTLGGEFKRPGTYTIMPGERLASVLRRAGGFSEKAFLKGAVFTRKSVVEVERIRLEEFIKNHEQRLLTEAGQLTQIAFGLSREESAARQGVLLQRIQGLRLVASKVTLGRVVVQLDELDKLEASPNDILLEDGDTLMIPQKPATVVVMGSVRNPTAVLHQEGSDVQHYLNRAGGLAPEADAKGLYLVKADGSAITGFMRLRSIEPGDVIIAPPTTEAKVQWGPLLKDLVGFASQMALGLVALAAIF